MVCTSAILVLTAPLLGQSLRQLAKEQGGTSTSGIDYNAPVSTVPSLLQKSDLVLYGRIAGIRTELTEDERFVATAYTVTALRMIKQTQSVNTSRTPGAVPSIIVKRIGGTLTEGELRYSTTNNEYPLQEPLHVGDEVVLFLHREGEAEGYSVSGGPFGLFLVSDDQVAPISKQVVRRRGDRPMPLAAFLEYLRRQAAGKQQN